MKSSNDSLRRLFVAVVPPLHIVEAVTSLLPRESSRLMQWTTPIRLHISIDFLGRVNGVDTFLQDLSARVGVIDPFTVRLRGAGAFPEARRAEVFWLGIEDAESGLRAAHVLVLEAARVHGIRIASHIFTPQLTIARLNRKADLRPDIAALEGVAIGEPWRVEEILLLDAPKSRGSKGDVPFAQIGTLRLGQ